MFMKTSHTPSISLLVALAVATTLVVATDAAGITLPDGWNRLQPPPLQATVAAPIDYLDNAPRIDGRLDGDLVSLPRRAFTTVLTSDGAAVAAAAHYRLAHGADFFYVYVEVAAEQVVHRDRAYQNGDGLQLLLARPTTDGSPSRDFHVIACSAVDRPEQEWSRRFIWYQHVDRLFVRLGEGAQVAHQVHGGRLAFEVLLPWREVHPHHPWFGPLGFNLCLVKAVGATDTHTYWVELDPWLGSEGRPRSYVPITFAGPRPSARAVVQLERGHVSEGRNVSARVAAAGPTAVRLELQTGEGATIRRWTARLAGDDPPLAHEEPLALDDSPPGGYRVVWRVLDGQDQGEAGLSILPRSGPADLARTIAGLPDAVAAGTHATLAFRAEDLAVRLQDRRPYETAAVERLDLERLVRDVTAATRGDDPIAGVRGDLRRAFRSAFDSTLQPYSLRLPEDLGARDGERLPLLVYLHGSGEDDRVLWRTPDYGQGCLPVIAPCGRGRSHGWSTVEAQIDVAEALADALTSYPFDPDRVVLLGFSMGGYGALRTYYADGDRYRAVAVFGGHPDLGNRYLGTDTQPDFRDPDVLKAFAGVPVFVQHGRQDRNCPFELAEQMVAALVAAGAEVTFCVDDDRGHEAAGPGCLGAFQAWLQAVLSL
jgi:predicted esterase